MTALNPQGGDPRLLSPLALAFVGDGVYELLVREHLLAQGNAPVGRLHSRKHTNPAVYRRATGMEALFGWLYLSGQVERANQLFAAVLESREGTEEER